MRYLLPGKKARSRQQRDDGQSEEYRE